MREVLSSAEQRELSELVAQIEQRTASELVVVVLPKSLSYAQYRVTVSLVIGLAGAGIASFLHPGWPGHAVLGLQLVFGLFGHWVLANPALLRRCVPKEVMDRAVHERAEQLFVSLGVTETRERSGILVLLSSLERRVELLADRGIYQQLGGEVWNQLVAELSVSIKNGAAKAGLERLLAQLGDELAARYPVRPDDTNELSNRIVTRVD